MRWCAGRDGECGELAMVNGGSSRVLMVDLYDYKPNRHVLFNIYLLNNPVTQFL